MALDVVLRSSELLTATSTLKEDMGITTTSDDVRLERLIRQVTAWAETVVGYPLMLASYRETLAGFGTRNLMLSRTPLRAVSALFFGTDTGDDAEQFLSSDFGIDREAGFLTRTEGWDWTVPVTQDLDVKPVPGSEFEPWLADYIAGYTLAGIAATDTGGLYSTEKGTTSTGRTLPPDIEQAALIKASGVWRGNDNVFSKQVGDLRIQYGAGQSGIVTDSALEILRRYARTF